MKYYLGLVGIFIQINLIAQTTVSGPISTNTTWTQANSPYHVVGDVLVNNGVTLTIDPGVLIELDTNKTITSLGTIIAIGTESQKIELTRYATTPNLGIWNAIELLNANAVYNTNGIYQSGDILKHVDISYGRVIVDGSIHIVSSSIGRSDGTGLSLIHEDSVQLAPISKILKTKIFNHLGDGINILSHHFLIDSCEISNNFQAVDFLYASNAYLGLGEIRNSKILNHASNGIVYSYEGDFPTTDTIVIRGNLIYNCQDTAFIQFKYGTIDFRRNRVIGNRLGIHFRGASIVDSNIIASTWDGIPIRAIVNLRNYFRHNLICFNNSKNNGGCGIRYNKGKVLEHNTITGNRLTYSSSSTRSATLQRSGSTSFGIERVNFNNIFGNDSEYEYQTEAGNENCFNNYWGTKRDTCIAEKIYDRVDHGFGVGFVYYSPFLIEPDTTSPISPPSLVGKELSPNGEIMLYWKPNPEGDVAGYKIHWSNPTGYSFDTMVDVGLRDHFILKGISDTNAVYSITAYDNLADGFDDMLEGHESWYSPAISSHQNDVIRMNSCQSIISPSGRVWTQTGMYLDTLQPLLICDETQAYFVRIGTETNSMQNISSCGDYSSPSGKYLWTIPGTYMDTIQNYNGCDSVMTINLSILSSSVSNLDTTICKSMISPSGKYVWTIPGIYKDTLTNSLGCDSIISVQVRNNFNKVLQISNGFLVTNNTGITYQWLDCNNGYAAIPGATSLSYKPTVNGSYALTVFDGSCTDTTDCIMLSDIGLKNKILSNEIQYFPNPIKGKINIDLGSTYSKVKLEVIDPMGRLVESRKLQGVQQFEVELTGAKGFYILKIEVKKGGKQDFVELKVLKG